MYFLCFCANRFGYLNDVLYVLVGHCMMLHLSLSIIYFVAYNWTIDKDFSYKASISLFVADNLALSFYLSWSLISFISILKVD